MNHKFHKALYLLDLGKYQEGEGLIRQAIEETQNLYEKMPMAACYTELLYKLERYEDAMKYIEYILDNSSEEMFSKEHNMALEIKHSIVQKKP